MSLNGELQSADHQPFGPVMVRQIQVYEADKLPEGPAGNPPQPDLFGVLRQTGITGILRAARAAGNGLCHVARHGIYQCIVRREAASQQLAPRRVDAVWDYAVVCERD